MVKLKRFLEHGPISIQLKSKVFEIKVTLVESFKLNKSYALAGTNQKVVETLKLGAFLIIQIKGQKIVFGPFFPNVKLNVP